MENITCMLISSSTCVTNKYFLSQQSSVYSVMLYFEQIDELFEAPVTHLRSSCTTEEHRKLDKMIHELTSSIDTLRSELRPSDDLHAVEEQLDIALHETEDIEHGKV